MGSAVTTGNAPESVAFSPSGSLLATADSASNNVVVFSVSSSGALTTVPGDPFYTGNGPFPVAFSPSGSNLATANATANTISIFAIH